MTDDRELLELAAKAAGYELEWESVLPGEDPDGYVGCDCIIKGTRRFWNPLTDDGDALRLAVKLKITLDFGDCGHTTPSHISARCYIGRWVAANQRLVHQEYVPEEMFVSDYASDRKHAAYQLEEVRVRGLEAATRRAIVRAAAAIGKEMP